MLRILANAIVVASMLNASSSRAEEPFYTVGDSAIRACAELTDYTRRHYGRTFECDSFNDTGRTAGDSVAVLDRVNTVVAVLNFTVLNEDPSSNRNGYSLSSEDMTQFLALLWQRGLTTTEWLKMSFAQSHWHTEHEYAKALQRAGDDPVARMKIVAAHERDLDAHRRVSEQVIAKGYALDPVDIAYFSKTSP
ncbi:hypothetical protein AWB67_05513 [Caballeronia terrestris]|jgi:hypothetical protein|uniref:Lipoprotein n=1 Tax=Caballeronia terrestris TaxID=1226301 RepID=A0A158KFF9_9BURK|nr:hypothetical protein [Caballeronia terrestris]SAL79794.1 hypothetical protein AWB67_05513 [Caballeronia terrestris]